MGDWHPPCVVNVRGGDCGGKQLQLGHASSATHTFHPASGAHRNTTAGPPAFAAVRSWPANVRSECCGKRRQRAHRRGSQRRVLLPGPAVGWQVLHLAQRRRPGWLRQSKVGGRQQRRTPSGVNGPLARPPRAHRTGPASSSRPMHAIPALVLQERMPAGRHHGMSCQSLSMGSGCLLEVGDKTSQARGCL